MILMFGRSSNENLSKIYRWKALVQVWLIEIGRCNGEDEMTVVDFDVRSIVERRSIKNLSMEGFGTDVVN